MCKKSEVLTYDWIKTGGRSGPVNAVIAEVGCSTNLSACLPAATLPIRSAAPRNVRHRPLLFFSTSPFTLRPNLYFSNMQRATDGTRLDTSVRVGLFLGCSSCHLSAKVFFLLNFFVVEGRCEVFGLEDLANLYVGFAFVAVGASLDPLDGLFERLDLPEPEA